MLQLGKPMTVTSPKDSRTIRSDWFIHRELVGMTTPEKPTKKRPSSPSLDTSSSFNPFTMMMPHKKMTAIKWRLGAFSLGRMEPKGLKKCTSLKWHSAIQYRRSTQGACQILAETLKKQYHIHQSQMSTAAEVVQRVRYLIQIWIRSKRGPGYTYTSCLSETCGFAVPRFWLYLWCSLELLTQP